MLSVLCYAAYKPNAALALVSILCSALYKLLVVFGSLVDSPALLMPQWQSRS
jgi:hypothetical protein